MLLVGVMERVHSIQVHYLISLSVSYSKIFLSSGVLHNGLSD